MSPEEKGLWALQVGMVGVCGRAGLEEVGGRGVDGEWREGEGAPCSSRAEFACAGFRVQGSGFRVQGSGVRVQGSGCGI